MPNMSSHMAIAKKVSEILNINDPEFYKGNIYPDLFEDKIKSHYKIEGKKYLIPDIEEVKRDLDLNNTFNLGILTHLLLDKYYFDDYLLDIEDDVFKEKKIYMDYDILNKDIVKYFNLDINYFISILKDFDKDIDIDKLKFNIECLEIIKDGKTLYLDKDKFIKFLNDISIKIANELKDIKEFYEQN